MAPTISANLCAIGARRLGDFDASILPICDCERLRRPSLGRTVVARGAHRRADGGRAAAAA